MSKGIAYALEGAAALAAALSIQSAAAGTADFAFVAVAIGGAVICWHPVSQRHMRSPLEIGACMLGGVGWLVLVSASKLALPDPMLVAAAFIATGLRALDGLATVDLEGAIADAAERQALMISMDSYGRKAELSRDASDSYKQAVLSAHAHLNSLASQNLARAHVAHSTSRLVRFRDFLARTFA